MTDGCIAAACVIKECLKTDRRIVVAVNVMKECLKPVGGIATRRW